MAYLILLSCEIYYPEGFFFGSRTGQNEPITCGIQDCGIGFLKEPLQISKNILGLPGYN